jgi:hypothetical protein
MKRTRQEHKQGFKVMPSLGSIEPDSEQVWCLSTMLY